MRCLPHSLLGRMLAVQLATLLLVAITLPLFGSYLLSSTADAFVAGRLESDALKISAGLRATDKGITLNRQPHLGPSFDADGGSKAFAILAADGSLVAKGSQPMTSAQGLQAIRNDTFIRRGDFDIWVHPVRTGSLDGAVIVEQNRSNPDALVDDVVGTFLKQFFWLLPLVLLVLFVSGAMVARTTSRSIRQNAEHIDQIDATRLDIRIDSEALPSELAPIARASNRAFDRLEVGFREQNEFIANVAHELRTPLAVVALRSEAIEDVPLRTAVRKAIARTSHVIGQLMEFASIENSAPEFTPLELDKLTLEAVMEHAPLAYLAGKKIEFKQVEHSIAVTGNAGLIGIVLSNLIDNAIKHTPAGTSITVRLGPSRTISVIDNGPGIHVADKLLIRQRYWRADQRRNDGAGLGLSISERIMALHKGKLELFERPGGGTHLQMTF